MNESIQFSTTRPLYGQVAVVTGASRGIGSAIAISLAKAGASVAVNYVSSSNQALDVVSVCRSFGSQAMAISADVTKEPQVASLFTQIEATLGAPSSLVNNAGHALTSLLIDTTPQQWDDMMSMHLKAPYLCIRRSLDHMIRAKYGRIINISSIWGIVGGSCESAYSAAKGGVIAFTKALSKELAPSGITVNAVAPGVVDTDMIQDLTEEDRDSLVTQTPVGRLGTPGDIAALVTFLANPGSSFLTGQVISPNGGLVT